MTTPTLNLHVAPSLSGLKKALQAPEPQQMPVFLQEVMEPIRPCWETPMLRMGMADPSQDLARIAAQRFLFYTPEQGIERGLQALEQLQQFQATEKSLERLEKAIDLLEPAKHGIQLQDLHFVFVLGDPERMTPPLYTGVGNVPGWILLMAYPTEHNLPRLSAITVHEFHHQVRFQHEPLFPQMTLGKYIVAEGLAEAFAAQLCGEENLGPWATTLQPAELEAVKPRFAAALNLSDFTEVRGYIFGDWASESWGTPRLGIPDFAGYAVGYRMVQTYLSKTGKTITEATYTPWQEIIQDSGWFGL
ncbi:DUF2268 domain-containing protein [Deinococcus roseus]|uniref:DUF2268 domain-containing protein n=1 Tax=Deinococcus roseus TaxID=392414 RepID=A0ABQ2CX17_9DEIO|nr:DUF2268 domain-containing putative Zn-dependent protease [Deinococcus roseus]GGJ27968.1 hypothetical protein GCM10008938_12530 [Deinococcus roseus]